jgi:hypothetical protein
VSAAAILERYRLPWPTGPATLSPPAVGRPVDNV